MEVDCIGACETCQRLWREYSSATTEHVKLENKLRLAALKRDYEGLKELTLKVEQAVHARETAREDIRLHEVMMHSRVLANGAVE